MSFVNFRRLFTKTAKLLTEQKFIELKGYTKLGLNTFPNMVPFLTGYHSDELIKGKDLMKISFEEWPIIWKNYSKKGFVTAFVEEMSRFGLFQFKRKGFRSKPTDYATRPFHMVIENDKYNQFCYKDKTETQVIISMKERLKFKTELCFTFHSVHWTLRMIS